MARPLAMHDYTIFGLARENLGLTDTATNLAADDDTSKISPVRLLAGSPIVASRFGRLIEQLAIALPSTGSERRTERTSGWLD